GRLRDEEAAPCLPALQGRIATATSSPFGVSFGRIESKVNQKLVKIATCFATLRGLSIKAAGDPADHYPEDQVQQNHNSGGGTRRIERYAGDEPFIDEGGKRGEDVDGLAEPSAQ